MRALLFQGPGTIEAAGVPEPTMQAPTDAIVELQAVGLCGSDLHPYLGREGARTGVIPGHEGTGRVLAVGADVAGIRPGDRVIVPFTTSCGVCIPCRSNLSSRCDRGALFGWGDPENLDRPALHGMQAERIRVPLADSTLVAIPESMSPETALLLSDNLPTGWYAALRAEAGSAPERIAVLGAGSVGVCAAVAAVHLGAAHSIVIEPVEQRRLAVAGLRRVEAVHPEDDRLRQIGTFPSIIDAAGTVESQRLAFEIAAPGATISLIAVQTEPAFGFTPVDVYDRNLTIRSGRAPVRSLLNTLLPMVADGSVLDPSEQVFTHRSLPLSEGPDTYRRFAERADGLIKAWFDPAR